MEWDWTIAVGTFLAGQVAVIGVEWVRHLMSRHQRRRDARDDLQLQTLKDLQEALYQHFRGMRNSLAEYKQLTKGGPPLEWHVLEDPRVISAGISARIIVLTERVRDAEVRDLVDQFNYKSEVMISERDDTSIETFEAGLEELREAHRRVNKRIGELLRML